MDKRWGIGERVFLSGYRKTANIPKYEVMPTGQVAFLPEHRRVCMNVTLEEAQALCTIMNAGENNGRTV